MWGSRWYPRIAIAVALVLSGLVLRSSDARSENSAVALQQAIRDARTLATNGDVRAAFERGLRAQRELDSLGQPASGDSVILLLDLARYAAALHKTPEAREFARKSGEAGASVWSGDPERWGSLADEIAQLLDQQGDYAAAIGFHETAAKALSSGKSAAAAKAANAWGVALLELNQPEKALSALVEAHRRLAAKGAGPVDQVPILVNLVNANLALGDLAEAGRALDEAETLAKGDPNLVWQVRYARALLLARDGHLREANDLLTEIAKPRSAVDGMTRAHILMQLSNILILRGLYVEAEPIVRAAIDAYGKLLGSDHPFVAPAFRNLAQVYQQLGSKAEAAGYYDRAIGIETRAFGTASAQTQATSLERAILDLANDDVAAAKQRAETALRLLPLSLASSKRLLGIGHVILGLVAHRGKDRARASAEFESAIRLIADAMGEASSDLYLALIEVGAVYTDTGQYDKAEAALSRAARILERDAAVAPWKLPRALATFAELRERQGDHAAALEKVRAATTMLLGRLGITDNGYSGLGESEQRVARSIYLAHARLATIGLEGHSNSPDLLAESFEVAQAAQSSTAARSVNQMTARFSREAGSLGELVRSRQDETERWRYFDGLLRRELTKPTLGDGASYHADLVARMSALEKKIAGIDRAIERDFPGYAALVSPRPVLLAKVRAALRPGEALLLHLVDDRGTLLWWVTADGIDFAHLSLTRSDLDGLVRSVRASVTNAPTLENLPPFDTTSAFKIFENTIAPFRDQMASTTHLLVIPDGPLQSLPLSLLIEHDTPAAGRNFEFYRKMPWIVRHLAITTLPSVNALLALRLRARRSGATRAFLGVGDPIFTVGRPVTAVQSGGESTRPGLDDIFSHGSRVSRSDVARLSPLPETEDELRTLKDEIGGSSQILTGAHASEREIFQLRLDTFRTIAFATHGLLAGDFTGLAEPALALTPDSNPTSPYNGLLTASKITQLKLDADLVLLSACNTADPEGRPGAEGVRGLAEAFFYAGARSILVSHWSVYSLSAKELTTGMFREIKDHQGEAILLSEALRRTMVHMIDDGNETYEAHPLFWAPYVIVGDGS